MQKTIFFDKRNINKKKAKPKPIVYHIYLCTKYNQLDETDIGAWSSLIIKQPQDSVTKSKEKHRSSYMLSCLLCCNHIRIRLFGLKESLEWIISAIDEKHIPYVEVMFASNDVFLVNTLKEWIPKWSKNDFMKDDNETKRPNHDILSDIAKISNNIKMNVRWINESSFEMINLSKKVDSLLEENKDNTEGILSI